MNTFHNDHHGNKGFVLVTILLVCSVLFGIAIPYISRIASEYSFVSKMNSSTVAINVAEAGIERAIWEICYHGSAFSGWTHTGTNLTLQTWAINNVQFRDLSGKVIGIYDALVSLSIGSNIRTITVTAYVPSKTQADGKKTIVVNYSSGGLFPLSNAIAANGLSLTGEPLNNSIKIDANVGFIDSYDSAIGPYSDPKQVNRSLANIVTNGDIQMSAAASHVKGSAYYGGKFAGNKKSVTGIVDKLQAPLTINFPDNGLTKARTDNANARIAVFPVPVPGYVPLDSDNNLLVQKGTTITLNYDPDPAVSNTYYFKSVSMGGDGTANAIKVTGDGPVIVYVDGGKITTSGITSINTVDPKGADNPLPGNLIIYSNYNGTDIGVSLGDNCDIYGALYAPEAITEVGKVNFYGAVVCKTISFYGGTNLHFDTELVNAMSDTSNDGPTSWQER